VLWDVKEPQCTHRCLCGLVVKVPSYRSRSGFDYWRYQIFWEVVGLEQGPLSLVSTVELLGRKGSDSGLEIREYGCRDPSRWPRDTLYPQQLVPTSPTNGGSSVGIVRSRTRATEFSCFYSIFWRIHVCVWETSQDSCAPYTANSKIYSTSPFCLSLCQSSTSDKAQDIPYGASY
jgi:hypothetical protein